MDHCIYIVRLLAALDVPVCLGYKWFDAELIPHGLSSEVVSFGMLCRGWGRDLPWRGPGEARETSASAGFLEAIDGAVSRSPPPLSPPWIFDESGVASAVKGFWRGVSAGCSLAAWADMIGSVRFFARFIAGRDRCRLKSGVTDSALSTFIMESQAVMARRLVSLSLRQCVIGALTIQVTKPCTRWIDPCRESGPWVRGDGGGMYYRVHRPRRGYRVFQGQKKKKIRLHISVSVRTIPIVLVLELLRLLRGSCAGWWNGPGVWDWISPGGGHLVVAIRVTPLVPWGA